MIYPRNDAERRECNFIVKVSFGFLYTFKFSKSCRNWIEENLLVQRQPVVHAVLNIHPDEIRLSGGNQLGHEGAWDTLRDAHEGLARICLGVFEGLFEVCRLREHSGTVGCFGVELGLLAVRLEVRHLG